MLNRLKRLFHYRKQFISLLVGVPSYEKYVEHMAVHHPEEPVKSRKEFFCEAQEARYSGKGGKVSRCC
ncbi:MAG: YbdD/YjiX family protein [Mesobacillus sp.]|uniref:YbdD/YjiX family protein n=1 Tax=Mesobacillus sp. TaxID=2675271 RepID=UPI003C53D0BD